MSSPSADVRLNVSANSAAAQLDMMTSKMKRYLKSMETGTDTVNRKGKKTNQTLGSWAGSLAKTAVNMLAVGAAMGGVYSVAQLISKEFQIMADRSNMARERQLPAQELAKSFYLQSIPATVKDKDEFMAQINEKVAGSNVQDKSNLWRLLSTSMSTMGNADPMERADFALTVAGARRDLMGGRFEQLNTFGGVASAAHLNFKDQGSTARAQIELMQKTMTASMVSDMTSFSRNIAPVANKLAQHGVNQIEGSGLSAALSTTFNDQTGQLVDTAANNIMAKLKLVETRFGIESEGKTLLQRREMIRSDDPRSKRAREFLLASFAADADELTDLDRSQLSDAQLNKRLNPKVGGRAKTIFGTMQFFQPAGTHEEAGSFNDLFDSNLREIGAVFKSKNVIDVQATYKALEAEQRRKQNFVETSEMFRVANDQLKTKEATESILSAAENPFIGEMTKSGGDYEKLMYASGQSYLDRTVNQYLAMFSAGETSEDTLLRMKSEVEWRMGVVRGQDQLDNQRYRDKDGNVTKHLPEFFNAGAYEMFYEPSEQANTTVAVLAEKLDTIATQLELIRNQGDDPKPKKVEIDDKKPAPPRAVEINN